MSFETEAQRGDLYGHRENMFAYNSTRTASKVTIEHNETVGTTSHGLVQLEEPFVY